MYRRNIAAAAAVLFLSSAVGISAYAAPQKDNSATEAETETETETETQTETETETETETQETEAATEREAGFVSIEEMPFEIETETETESSDQTETETETEQKIESPKVEQTFRFFQVEKKYAVSKRDDVYLYEKKNTKSDKVGKINALGVLHILEEDNDGEWYYVESGKARGFIKAKYVWADEKAERYVKHKKEKNIETAEVLKEAYENKAFLHTQTTAYKAVAKKKYALTKKRIKIYDSIPQEETKNNKKEETEKETQESTASESEKQSSSVTEGETQDNSAKESETPDSASGESETQESEKKKSTDQKSEKSEDTEKDQEPEVVGTLEKGGLCYILDDEDQEWSYVESDDVRGFVQTKQLETGKKVKKEIEEKGEDTYALAKAKVKPEDNKACYYTVTSVKEASVSGLIRTSMLEYAKQFLGDPYVWGGTSLTKGADCSGFVQSIYAEFGYSIPRVAEDQAECATKIPVEDALPGDLIFYQRSDGYIYHVVMSTGDGGTIEAHSSATGIIESTVNENDAVWAVRIISNEDTDILDALKKKDMAADYYDNAVIAKSTEYGSYLGKFKLTAYCSCPICCGVWSGGPTASGAMPTIDHTVAMAGLPFGTELIINGQVYTVEDLGTPYGHVDIYMNNHQAALQFGVQYSDVYLKK